MSSFCRSALALVLFVAGGANLCAQEPAKASKPPIFSAPRSSGTASNLNQLGPKSSSLTDLESGLKKPFEIFDSARPTGDFRPPTKYTPPAPVLKNKTLKDLLDKQAEEMYLSDDDNGSKSGELLASDEEGGLIPSGKRTQTSLERYYDRIDRTKLAATNQATDELDIFGNSSDPDDKGLFKSKTSGGLIANEMTTLRPFTVRSNRSFGEFPAERAKSRSFGDLYGLGLVDSPQPTDRGRETRKDEFQRLLDGPSYGSRSGFNVAPPPAASSAPKGSKPVSGVPSSLFPGTALGSGKDMFANTPGFSGAVKLPSELPDYAFSTPSLTPTPPLTPPPSPKLPPPSFSVPRRRF